MMKKILTMLLVLALAMWAACALAVPAYELDPVMARPAEKLSFRSGPGTDYTELFSISGKDVTDFFVYEQVKGGSTMWGMVEFNSRYGRYRAYTGMKRIHTDAYVPYGNIEGETYRLARDAYAYWGPGRDYVAHEGKVPSGTMVTVYHEENGYVMADFVLPGGKKRLTTRAWIAADALRGYASSAPSWGYSDSVSSATE